MMYRKLLVVLAACAAGFQAYAQTAPRFRAERVPTISPSCATFPGDALDINNAGAVIGQRCIGAGNFAVIWRDGNIRLLPQDIEGNAQSLRLNDRFDAIMQVTSATQERRQLFVRNDGATLQINPLPGDIDLSLVSLNNVRQVLGHSVGNAGGLPSGRVPFIWHRGRARALSALPDTFRLTASNLNDFGIAIGTSSSSPDNQFMHQRAVLWVFDTVMPLPLPDGAIGSSGIDINNRGQAVFSAHFNEDGTEPRRRTQAYLWHLGRLRALPLLPIGPDDLGLVAGAADINNHGQVVGVTVHREPFNETPVRRATLWRDGAVHDLQDLLIDENGEPVTNLSLKAALAINDVGQILVREFIDPLEPPEYFVLTPVSATD